MKPLVPVLAAIVLNFVSPLSAEDNVIDGQIGPDASPIVEEWTFPYESEGGIGTIGIAKGPIQTSIIRTSKPFHNVWSFYAKKTGSEKQFSAETACYDQGTTRSGRYFIRDIQEEGKALRTFFVYTCAEYTVTATVNPGRDKTTVDMMIVAHR